ncbi:MAG: S-methyl-5-thioribose-1-phosphate isomerase [Ignavibacteriales bacterium]|nr:S-methyl-5-thioribose-1-phosphate isomerase [Ignavibacteriales bacterium]
MTPLEWREGVVRFLDQTKLPAREEIVETSDYRIIAEAIKRLAIRGAPLIGIAAAYGVALAAFHCAEQNAKRINDCLEKVIATLAGTRPTAVNLFWALERQRAVVSRVGADSLPILRQSLVDEAIAIHREDAEMCEAIGKHGSEILPHAATILTHCNAGALATGGIGTALGVIRMAWEMKKLKHVYVDETRPLLQGSRLTAWELQQLDIPYTLLPDNAAAFLMQRGLVSAVVVGADRVAHNGDVANKVGTYGLAIAARHHRIPFYVAAPVSTIDFAITRGSEIPIEQRRSEELTEFNGVSVAPPGVEVYSPAFDVTPHDLITAMITNASVVWNPNAESMAVLKSKLAQASTGR